MKREKQIGKCAICGTEGELTKEHVPPQKAFNDQSYISVPFEQAQGLRYDERPTAKPIQGGIHYYSICGHCNNSTGSWYGDAYISWCNNSFRIGKASNFQPTLLHLHLGFPLRIIKQVITMFFSVSSGLADRYPELVKFVLNKEQKYLPEQLRVYAYYNFEGNPRYNGFSAGGQYMSKFAEIAFPPLGFVLCFNSPPPDTRLYEISFFAESGYNEFRDVVLHLTNLPTHLQIPGTYLTKEQIEKNYEENGFKQKEKE